MIGEQVKTLIIKYKILLIEANTGRISDLTTPEGIKEWQNRNAESEYLRNSRSLHTIKGNEWRRQHLLVSSPPFGYKVENGKYVINNDRYKKTEKTIYEVAREIIKYFIDSKSYSKTVRYFNSLYGEREKQGYHDFPHVHSALKRWLKNPVLEGHTVYFREGKVERIPIFQ